MKPLHREQLWDLAGYETQRERFRREIIALKKTRRVALGPRSTLVFENHNTLLFQVQEMLRVERLSEASAIQGELDVYNELLPDETSLSATLFIEITDLADIRPELDRLIGLDEHVYLRVGDETLRATFDPKQMEADRISAVQYVRFPLSPEARGAFLAGAAAVLGIDHPNYTAEVPVGEALRATLAADLQGETQLLLPAPPAASETDVELFLEGSARAFRPAGAWGRGKIVVEPSGPPVVFLDASPEQHADCAKAIRRVVAELGAHHIEGQADPSAPLRFLLTAS